MESILGIERELDLGGSIDWLRAELYMKCICIALSLCVYMLKVLS